MPSADHNILQFTDPEFSTSNTRAERSIVCREINRGCESLAFSAVCITIFSECSREEENAVKDVVKRVVVHEFDCMRNNHMAGIVFECRSCIKPCELVWV